MKTTFYKCIDRTEATDKANLYYIQVNAAKRITDERERKEITISNGHGNTIAVFTY